MGSVAVAGGLGDLGRTIVEAILQYAPYHRVYILTRKLSLGQTRSGGVNAPENTIILELDYYSTVTIADELYRHKIDTVISTLNLDFETIAQAQLNLICGAVQSGVVKRFIPSDFNVDYRLSDEIFPYPEKTFHNQARAELDKYPQMIYCSIQPGKFMDYYGIPHAETHMKPLAFLVDIPFATAAVPGDGEAEVVFTLTHDVGRYIAALLDVPADQWPRDVICEGSRMSTNQLIALMERITGTKFDVKYDAVSKLRANRVTELPSNRAFYYLFPKGKEQVDLLACYLGIAVANGAYNIKGVSLRDMFPHIQPRLLEEFLTECWSGKYVGKDSIAVIN